MRPICTLIGSSEGGGTTSAERLDGSAPIFICNQGHRLRDSLFLLCSSIFSLCLGSHCVCFSSRACPSTLAHHAHWTLNISPFSLVYSILRSTIRPLQIDWAHFEAFQVLIITTPSLKVREAQPHPHLLHQRERQASVWTKATVRRPPATNQAARPFLAQQGTHSSPSVACACLAVHDTRFDCVKRSSYACRNHTGHH